MEKVQLALERFLPELRDLEQRKLFTKSELEAIVKQRRKHETALVSRSVQPKDYLRYIDYEKSLDRLRLKRLSTKSNNHASTSTSTSTNKKRRTLSDHSIQQHVATLYRLASTRFPESILVWDYYVRYALDESRSALLCSRVLAQAIAMHPHTLRYWLTAARFEAVGAASSDDHEMMGGGNFEAARKLLMRALRFVKSRRDLRDQVQVWTEWIKLEIEFVRHVRKRWRVLGIRTTTTAESSEFRVVVPEQEDDEAERIPTPNQGQEEDGQEAILKGAIVLTVLQNAFESTRHALEMYQNVLDLLRSMSMPGTSAEGDKDQQEEDEALRVRLLEATYDQLRHNQAAETDKDALVDLFCRAPLLDFLSRHAAAEDGETGSPKAWTDPSNANELLEAIVASVERYTARINDSGNVQAMLVAWIDESVLGPLDQATAAASAVDQASLAKAHLDLRAYIEAVKADHVAS